MEFRFERQQLSRIWMGNADDLLMSFGDPCERIMESSYCPNAQLSLEGIYSGDRRAENYRKSQSIIYIDRNNRIDLRKDNAITELNSERKIARLKCTINNSDMTGIAAETCIGV